MQGIIIFIVIAVISSLFSKDKGKQKPNKQMPSFGQQKVPEKSNPVPNKQKPAVKSLEDFANEIFGQLSEKNEPVKPVQKQQPKPVIVERMSPITQSKKADRQDQATNRSGRSSRPPLKERPLTLKLKEKEKSTSFMPKSREDLVQGIVMAEVLGQPKAKRK